MSDHTLASATLFLLGWLTIAQVSAQTFRNVSVDDQSSMITYVPSSSWRLTDPGEWDAGVGRAHMVTNDLSAYATFTFTGVAFFYYSAQWPYRVATGLSINGGPLSTIDQQDHGAAPTESVYPTIRANILAWAVGLPNQEHTIRVSVPPGYDVAVVDYFVYTQLLEDPSSSLSSTSSSSLLSSSSQGAGSSILPSSSSGLPPAQSHSDTNGVPPGIETSAGGRPESSGSENSGTGPSTAMIVGIVLAIVSAILLAVVILLISRWLKKRRSQRYPQPDSTFGAYTDNRHSVLSNQMYQQPSPHPPAGPATSYPGYSAPNFNATAPNYHQPQTMAPVAQSYPPPYFSPTPDGLDSYRDSYGNASSQTHGSSYYAHLMAMTDGSDNQVYHPGPNKSF
ncbi:hypothetical protein FA15DRAFT_704482 [Coprinopsis marcescibilis]|uniref:Mid2 domain-containing protein n=1 Tax=Coprinopsis marcescibilis TaxID=230819 RepID=A0A5C3KVY5_COPMA|nr:hypothetical protein FA15DRAFT_704482 [Coprinopsis marcescibilis]